MDVSTSSHRMAASDLEPTEKDRLEASLSAGVQALDIRLSDHKWDELCTTVTKEFARLNKRAG